MTPEKQLALQEHIQAIARSAVPLGQSLKYCKKTRHQKDAPSLGGIAVGCTESDAETRNAIVWFFFIKTVTGLKLDTNDDSKVSKGELPITSKQATEPQVHSRTQQASISRNLLFVRERECQSTDAASDIEYFTGVQVSLSLSTTIGASPEQ